LGNNLYALIPIVVGAAEATTGSTNATSKREEEDIQK